MRKPIIYFSLVLAMAAAAPGARAEIIYRQGEGWSTAEEDSGPVEKTASEQFRKAEELENKGEKKKALGAYKHVVRHWPNSTAAMHAQIRIAELYQSLGDPEKAFEAYGKYISSYPSGQDFERAVEGQYKIAVSFLEGERRKVFGVKTFSSMQRAHEMFAEVLKNAPYSRYAALASYNVGRALEKQGKLNEAVAAYQATVDRYPADEIAADAQYQIGYIYFSQARAGSNDQAARNKAREAFEDFILRFPRSEKVAQAEANIRALGEVDVKKTLDVALFYEKTKNYKAAAIYYDEVIRTAPDSKEAKTARQHLDKLRSSVGEDKLRAGSELVETGERAAERRKLRAQVDVASRPDYVGPPVSNKTPDEVAPPKPQFRTSGEVIPVPEPPLPSEGNETPAPEAPTGL